MKLNNDKCHLIVSGHKFENVWAKIGNCKIWESKEQTLLGVGIDRKLKFDDYVFNLCNKAGHKLSALARVSYYLTLEQRRALMKSFIESQFSYCPLAWMFHGRKANNRINHIHEQALRIVYKDENSTFNELLEKDKSCSVHHKNLQQFAIELYKVKNNFSTQIMNELFEFREVNYNLRNQTDFKKKQANTVSNGICSLRFFAAELWNMIPSDLKSLTSLELFKRKIKSWIPNCHCKPCLVYLRDIGYCTVEETM